VEIHFFQNIIRHITGLKTGISGELGSHFREQGKQGIFTAGPLSGKIPFFPSHAVTKRSSFISKSVDKVARFAI